MNLFDRVGIRLWFAWDMSDGRLLRLRYAVGHAHEWLFGCDPESDRWPFRLAHWLGLSGYAPSRCGWAKRFHDAYQRVQAAQ